MSVIDGYTKSSAYLQMSNLNLFEAKVKDSITLQTSIVLHNNNQEFIVPLDDDEMEIKNITPTRTDRLIVDELDAKERDGKDNQNLVTSSEDFGSDGFVTETIPQNEIDQLLSSVNEYTTQKQKELLHYHYKLKHLPFSSLKKLAQRGIIPKYLEKVPSPLCYGCQMGHAHRKPWRGKGKVRKHIRRDDNSFPGVNTSTDQMVSPYGGLIPQVRGKLMKAKYYGATIFVDHFSDFTYVHLMKDTTGESTLNAKHAYEILTQSYGHHVRAYHADNGRFAEAMFVQDSKDKAQRVTHCGVGSHHQNGIAERPIRTLTEDARTMLAHGQHLWPEVINKSLWPFAYKAASRSQNKFNLDKNGHSPEEKLSGLKLKHEIRNEHPLFCPVFVLDKSLQGSMGGLPKWNPRANAGVYLGHSPDHASNVALVLNLATGLVSPQYHVVFDDHFSTVDFIRSKRQPSNWEQLCRYHTEDFRMNILDDATTQDFVLNLDSRHNAISQPASSDNDIDPPAPQSPNASISPSVSTSASIPLAPEGEEGQFMPADNAQDIIPSHDSEEAHFIDHISTQKVSNDNQELYREPENLPLPSSEGESVPPTTSVRRSSRTRKPVDRLTSSRLGELRGAKALLNALGIITAYFTTINTIPVHSYATFRQGITQKFHTHHVRSMFYQETVELDVDGSTNVTHPLAFATQTAGNEVFHFHQAMRENDREEFIKAMIKELQDHQKNKHWKLVKRSEIGDAPTIKAIWSFKRKRRPDGSLL